MPEARPWSRMKAIPQCRRWLSSQCLLVLLLLGPVQVIAAEVYSEPSAPPANSQSVVAAPHQIPVLPPEVATEVKEFEHQIAAVLGRGEERCQEEIQSLIQAAERIVVLRVNTPVLGNDRRTTAGD